MSNCHGARRRIKKKIGMGRGSQTARHFSLGPVALWEKVQLVKNYKRKRIETENGNRIAAQVGQSQGNHSIGRLTDSHTLSNINGATGRWVNGSLEPFVLERGAANFDTNAPLKVMEKADGRVGVWVDGRPPPRIYSRTSGLWVHMTSYKTGGYAASHKTEGLIYNSVK